MVTIDDVVFEDFPLLLAPMEDVSDPPFRRICKNYGADMMYTEFISSEGLIRKAAKSVQKLDIFNYERPIGIQIFGDNIDSVEKAASISEEAKPDIIDINYGCPVKKVACKGAGAGILLDLVKMQKMTERVVKRVKVPVTVKTRLGWDDNTIKIIEVAKRLQDAGIKALTIHARTRKQMYKGEARWDYIAKVKSDPSINIPIFGNGDIDSPQKALLYKEKYGIDGIMIGRAAVGYPWIFREVKHYMKTKTLMPKPTMKERLDACQDHLNYSMQWKSEREAIYEMRRHYTNYFKNIEHFKSYRLKLVKATDYQQVNDTLQEIKDMHLDN